MSTIRSSQTRKVVLVADANSAANRDLVAWSRQNLWATSRIHGKLPPGFRAG
jgi:hypothetical protein